MTELAEALAAQARRQKKDRARLQKELLPALAYAARVGDAHAVAYIATKISALGAAA